MEELIDFLIDVFENVWRKFKINFIFISIGGIASAALLLPCIMRTYPFFSPQCIAIKVSLALISFILVKVCMITIKEVKINFNTLPIIFQNLLKPFIFCAVFALTFGILVFTALVPFIFPDYADRSFVIVAAIVAAIAALAILPNAVISMFFSYEGCSFKEALSAGNAVLDGKRGKMYFLTISLLLLTLILNLTYVGMIILLPLAIMTMDQSRESLVKIDDEKKRASEAKLNKQYQPYRPKVDYTQDYSCEKKPAKITKNEEEAVPEKISRPENAETAQKPQNIKTGLGGVFKMTAEEKKAAENVSVQKQPQFTQKSEPAKKISEDETITAATAGSETKTEKVPQKAAEKQNDKPLSGALNTNESQESKTVEPAAAPKKNDKIVSAAEYEVPQSSYDQINLSDFIDLGVSYEKDDKIKKDDNTEDEIDIEIEKNIEIEVEIEPVEKEQNVKKEYKSGKAYLDDFGTIKRKDIDAKPVKKQESQEPVSKNYFDDFGTIKKKK